MTRCGWQAPGRQWQCCVRMSQRLKALKCSTCGRFIALKIVPICTPSYSVHSRKELSGLDALAAERCQWYSKRDRVNALPCCMSVSPAARRGGDSTTAATVSIFQSRPSSPRRFGSKRAPGPCGHGRKESAGFGFRAASTAVLSMLRRSRAGRRAHRRCRALGRRLLLCEVPEHQVDVPRAAQVDGGALVRLGGHDVERGARARGGLRRQTVRRG
jgi:hypothetical protein